MHIPSKSKQIVLAFIPLILGATIIAGISTFQKKQTIKDDEQEIPNVNVVQEQESSSEVEKIVPTNTEESQVLTSKESNKPGFFVSIKSWVKNIFSKTRNELAWFLPDGVIDEQHFTLPESPSFTLIDPTRSLSLDARSFVVGDIETGEIILEKNARAVFPIASVTKLMTASVALDTIKKDTLLTVSSNALATEGTRGELRKNQKISFGTLLYPLLLVSSNDAAEVIAEGSGNRNKFIEQMNSKAKMLTMFDSSYADASGLSSKNMSSARDVFTLVTHIYTQQKELLDISKTPRYVSETQSWKNHNVFIEKDNYIGGKTGYTFDAQKTGVFAFSVPIQGVGERPIAVALLRSYNRTGDIAKILNYLSTNVRYENKNPTNSDTVTLGFVGDLMLDRNVRNSVQNNFAGSYDAIFEKMAPKLKSYDIMFGNLEGPIASEDRGTLKGSKYSFRMDPLVAPTLARAGFDIVSFANNHVGDYGIDAFTDTLTHLEQAGISVTGAGQNYEQSIKPTIIEKNGIKIGYLAFTDVGPIWMKATDTLPGTVIVDANYENIISNAKTSVDVLIVSMHAGEEYVTGPTKRQRELAHKAIDAGAHVFVGHHPHIVGPVEEYKNGVIAYSLGNAIFDQYFRKETMEGLLFEVTLSKNGLESHDSEPFLITKQSQMIPQDELETAVDRGVSVSKNENLTLAWAGDIVPGYEKNGLIQSPNTLFDDVRAQTLAPDIMIGNLEGVITNDITRKSRCGFLARNCFAFKHDETFASALHSAGFDIVNVANNHSYDFGVEGFNDTLELTKAAGLIPTGEPETITYVNRGDRTIAIVGFSYLHTLNHLDDHELVKSLIREAKQKTETVIVLVHAGSEGPGSQYTPDAIETYLGEERGNMRQFAHVAANAGATAVFGSGPHIIRGIEWYNNTLIAYSSGNFAGYRAFSAEAKETRDAFIIETTINEEGLIENARIVPIYITEEGFPTIHKNPTELFESISALSLEDFGTRAGLVDQYGAIQFPNHTETHASSIDGCPSTKKIGQSLILFNVGRNEKLPTTTPSNLVNVSPLVETRGRNICLTEETKNMFIKMVEDAKTQGAIIIPTSGYRDPVTQKYLFAQSSNKNKSEYSVAEPGHSEHHLGTTVDLTSPEIKYVSASPTFEETIAYTWLQSYAHMYGFVQSYPEGSEEKTGYIEEAWHWRYIGIDHAKAYREFNGTLEEYLESLQ